MTRALILMLDSLGVGASADATRYGDAGADTFGHIAESAANGAANREGLRQGPLAIPNLSALGLAHAAAESRGGVARGTPQRNAPRGMGICGGAKCGQGHAEWALGNGGCSGAV